MQNPDLRRQSTPRTQHPDDFAVRIVNAAWQTTARRLEREAKQRPSSRVDQLERRIEALEAELYRLYLRTAA